jgi:hypothetical protein
MRKSAETILETSASRFGATHSQTPRQPTSIPRPGYQTPEPGAPTPPSLYTVARSAAVIPSLSFPCQEISNSSTPGHPPSETPRPTLTTRGWGTLRLSILSLQFPQCYPLCVLPCQPLPILRPGHRQKSLWELKNSLREPCLSSQWERWMQWDSMPLSEKQRPPFRANATDTHGFRR